MVDAAYEGRCLQDLAYPRESAFQRTFSSLLDCRPRAHYSTGDFMRRLRGSGMAAWLWRVRRRINPATRWNVRCPLNAEPDQSAIALRARAFAGSWADGR
eukprot:2087290-Prymnesium_polylepis.1